MAVLPKPRQAPPSAKENEVHQLLLLGLSNKEIANKLGKSVHTVRYHVQRALRRRECENRLALLARTIKEQRPGSELVDPHRKPVGDKPALFAD
jgi:DNA-binding CsgD family transcriptional regulator